MLKAEKSINKQHHKSPWSPALHDAIQIVSIWKSIISQFKTKLSFQKQINFYQSSLSSPISIDWFNFADLKRKLRQAKSNLRTTTTNAKELRTQHLMLRASAMNIENKMTNSSTIINIQKIEQVILMWNKINYLTSEKKNSSLQTIDIPVDANINWNDIKKTKNLQFKTIDDPEIMEQVIAERNSHHLN